MLRSAMRGNGNCCAPVPNLKSAMISCKCHNTDWISTTVTTNLDSIFHLAKENSACIKALQLVIRAILCSQVLTSKWHEPSTEPLLTLLARATRTILSVFSTWWLINARSIPPPVHYIYIISPFFAPILNLRTNFAPLQIMLPQQFPTSST